MKLKNLYIFMWIFLYITPIFSETLVTNRTRKMILKELILTIVRLNKQIDQTLQHRESLQSQQDVAIAMKNIDRLKRERDFTMQELRNARSQSFTALKKIG